MIAKAKTAAAAIDAIIVYSAVAATADIFVVTVENASVDVDVARNDCRDRCVNGITTRPTCLFF